MFADRHVDVLDALLDLHAKLSTVVRYYDRMLEERLSNAYSHHSLGYGSAVPGAPQYSGMYPSMAAPMTSSPSGNDAAESFYYGSAPAVDSKASYNMPWYPQYQPERGGVPPAGTVAPASPVPAPALPAQLTGAAGAMGPGSPVSPLQLGGDASAPASGIRGGYGMPAQPATRYPPSTETSYQPPTPTSHQPSTATPYQPSAAPYQPPVHHPQPQMQPQPQPQPQPLVEESLIEL